MKTFFVLVIIIFSSQFAISQIDSTGSIEGKVTSNASKQPLLFANISIYKTGSATPESGTETDLDGNYSISNLDDGLYDIEVGYVGYSSKKVMKIKVIPNQTTIFNIELSDGVCTCPYIEPYEEPVIRLDFMTRGRVYTSDDLRKSPIRN